MKNCLQWRHLREKLEEATPLFSSELASIPVDWHMNPESADFLLKASVFSMCEAFDVADVGGGCVKPGVGPDVAEFVMEGRSDFLLVEYGGDLGPAMRREVGFHFRVCGGVMSWLVVWAMKYDVMRIWWRRMCCPEA